MGSETEPEVGLSRSSSLKPLAAHPFLPACSSLFLFLLGFSSLPSSFNSNRTPSLRAPTDDYDDSVVPVLVTRRQTPTLKTARRAAALSRLSACVRRCIRVCVCMCVRVCGIPGRHPRLVVARSIN